MRAFFSWLWALLERYYKDGSMFQAAYLAYLTLITMVPILALSLIILTQISLFKPIIGQLQTWLLHALLVNVADQVLQTIHEWVAHAATLSWSHIAVFAIMALLIMFNVNRVFRRIWYTKERLSWSVHCAFYCVVLFCTPLLLGVLFIVSGIVFQSQSLASWLLAHHLHRPIVFIMPDLVLFVWLTLMNWLLPLRRVPLRSAVLSGVVTTVLLIASKKIYAELIMNNSSYEMLYGALSVIPLFLAWLYVAWCIIIFGAMVGHEYEKRRQLAHH